MLEVLLTSAIPALLPAVADGVRGLFSKLTGGQGARPQNIEETVTLMRADTERLQALAQLDKAEGVHKWVADVRALQRPVAVVLVVGGYLGALLIAAPEPVQLQLGDLARMAIFYLFGDRTLFHLRRGHR